MLLTVSLSGISHAGVGLSSKWSVEALRDLEAVLYSNIVMLCGETDHGKTIRACIDVNVKRRAELPFSGCCRGICANAVRTAWLL